jgi:hypothetical protein
MSPIGNIFRQQYPFFTLDAEKQSIDPTAYFLYNISAINI